MTPHRALIEAAERALPHLEYKRTHTQTAEGRKSVARSIEALRSAISSAKAAEEGVEGSDLFCKTPVWLIRRIRELENQLAKEKAPERA